MIIITINTNRLTVLESGFLAYAVSSKIVLTCLCIVAVLNYFQGKVHSWLKIEC